jgi:hypothetical protein
VILVLKFETDIDSFLIVTKACLWSFSTLAIPNKEEGNKNQIGYQYFNVYKVCRFNL